MVVKHSIARGSVQRTQRSSEHAIGPLEVDVLISVVAGERVGVVQVIRGAPARALGQIENQNAWKLIARWR